MFPIPAAEELQSVIGLAAFGAIGFALLRLDDAQWETPAEALPAERAHRGSPVPAEA
jgi:hypothetical protein